MLTINNTVLGESCQVPSFDVSVFEIQDGKVNLTKICQSFGKDVNNWLRLKSTKEFFIAFEEQNQALQNMQTIDEDYKLTIA